MAQETQNPSRKQLGRRILIGVVASATLLLLLTIYQVDRDPRTDDANVWANFIEIDLLRRGRRVPMQQALPPAPYFIFLSRAERRPIGHVTPRGAAA